MSRSPDEITWGNPEWNSHIDGWYQVGIWYEVTNGTTVDVEYYVRPCDAPLSTPPPPKPPTIHLRAQPEPWWRKIFRKKK